MFPNKIADAVVLAQIIFLLFIFSIVNKTVPQHLPTFNISVWLHCTE